MTCRYSKIRSAAISILMCGVAVVVGLAVPVGYSLKVMAEERDVGASEGNADLGGDAVESEPGDEAGGEEKPPEISETIPEVYIKAVNPGFKPEGETQKVGEMIVIARKHADAPISLAGTTVGYTNTSGKTSTILEFPEHSWMTGETLLLRYKNSLESEQSNAVYSKSLAAGSGGVELVIDGEVVDRVCWTGKDGCAKPFTTANAHTTLVRNLENGEWENLPEKSYEVKYDAESYYVEKTESSENPKDEAETVGPSKCRGVQFSEILSYYENAKEEQFVELYNTRSEDVELDGCKLKYKNKNYALTGRVPAEGYYAYYPEGFSLTKNPSSSNELELVDANKETVDNLIYRKGQRKGTSYAMMGYDSAGEEIWKITYDPTPGEPNNYREFRTCESGKVLNETTGNCVKVANVTTTVCKAGYYRNLETGRCNKIKTASAQKECKEGYYRDPNTNRCRKAKVNNGADYSLDLPEQYNEQSAFVALYAVIGVAAVGGVYLIYEFRKDIAKGFRRVFRRR